MAIWLVVLIALLIAALLMGVTLICAVIASNRAKARREPAPVETPAAPAAPAE